jgi:hypothetical protein
MFHVKYRDFFKKLVIMEGRSDYEDAVSEAEDCASAGHAEVEILVSLGTADENMELAEADSRRFIATGVERGWPKDGGLDSLAIPTSPSSGG